LSVLAGDFTGCSVLIYDTDGNHLISTIVKEHDRGEQQIKINRMPSELKANDDCKVFLLSSPTPCEFSGKLKKVGGSLSIALFQGQEKENRGATRYAVSTPASIESLIVDGEAHKLQNPVNVTLINISTSGVRFRAPYYSFLDGDTFRMNLIISNSKKNITAEVINYLDNEAASSSDYGCRFMEIG